MLELHDFLQPLAFFIVFELRLAASEDDLVFVVVDDLDVLRPVPVLPERLTRLFFDFLLSATENSFKRFALIFFLLDEISQVGPFVLGV